MSVAGATDVSSFFISAVVLLLSSCSKKSSFVFILRQGQPGILGHLHKFLCLQIDGEIRRLAGAVAVWTYGDLDSLTTARTFGRAVTFAYCTHIYFSSFISISSLHCSKKFALRNCGRILEAFAAPKTSLR